MCIKDINGKHCLRLYGVDCAYQKTRVSSRMHIKNL